MENKVRKRSRSRSPPRKRPEYRESPRSRSPPRIQRSDDIEKMWENAINGDWDATFAFESREHHEYEEYGTNTNAADVSITFEIYPSSDSFIKQKVKDECGGNAVMNCGVNGVDVPLNASFQDIANATGGTILHTCLHEYTGKRKHVPHLIYTYDDYDKCSVGYLLPYTTTSHNQLVCSIDDAAIASWMSTYPILILLYEHTVGNPDGHYLVLKRAKPSLWTLTCGVCGVYHIKDTVAFLLIRGCVALIGRSKSGSTNGRSSPLRKRSKYRKSSRSRSPRGCKGPYGPP